MDIKLGEDQENGGPIRAGVSADGCSKGKVAKDDLLIVQNPTSVPTNGETHNGVHLANGIENCLSPSTSSSFTPPVDDPSVPIELEGESTVEILIDIPQDQSALTNGGAPQSQNANPPDPSALDEILAAQNMLGYDSPTHSHSSNSNSQDQMDFLDTDMEEPDRSSLSDTNSVNGAPAMECSSEDHVSSSVAGPSCPLPLAQLNGVNREISDDVSTVILVDENDISDDDEDCLRNRLGANGVRVSDACCSSASVDVDCDEGLGYALLGRTSNANTEDATCVQYCEACGTVSADRLSMLSPTPEASALEDASLACASFPRSVSESSGLRRSQRSASSDSADESFVFRPGPSYAVTSLSANLRAYGFASAHNGALPTPLFAERLTSPAAVKLHNSVNIGSFKGNEISRRIFVSPKSWFESSADCPLLQSTSSDWHLRFIVHDGGTDAKEDHFIWSARQAPSMQVSQLGPSSCGATAVANVLKAFSWLIPTDLIERAVPVRLRDNDGSVGRYLVSRSCAGTGAEDHIRALDRLTDGAIKGRFFHFYPRRCVPLLQWLSRWMTLGAVPVVTLNLQKGLQPADRIPDAWHHQMVYGVTSNGMHLEIHLTNPVEAMPVDLLTEKLCSDSILLVRQEDVRSRWDRENELALLLKQEDVRWTELNVIGQVVNLMREGVAANQAAVVQPITHVVIPAIYKSGVTLYARANSQAWELIESAPELPLC